jgi:alpha-galactosidase
MLQVGNLHGPLATTESRTHFGAWCIVSSPLVLGMDLRNETIMSAVWPYVANSEAIEINQRWEGDPGRVLNLSSTAGSTAAIEVWAKLQPSGAVALLAINTDAATSSAEISVDLSEVWPQGMTPEGWCRSKPCTVRDIWKQENGGQTHGGVWNVGALAPHDSAFALVSPQ